MGSRFGGLLGRRELAVVACAVGLAGCFRHMFLVVVEPRQIVLDCRILGEYFSTVRRISITRARDSVLIWQFEALSSRSQLHTVTFRAGANPRVADGIYLNSGVVIWPDAPRFTLEEGVEYRIAAWDDDLSKPNVSKRFLFPVKH